jgi:NAD(P)-dependent dehydrogenase (short-subunit alcohol dehydrogenase family)
MSTAPGEGVALVVGAGDATGGAVARRFARAGFVAAVARRHGDKLAPLVAEIEAAGGRAHGFALDARKEDQVTDLVARIEDGIGAIEVAVYNIGANVNFPIAETTSRVYYKVWEMACFGAFLVGREAARRMAPRGRGTIIFTGATASVMGRTGFAAFAGAKFAKRALAQSMARELGPKGVHVAHVIIDGPIDTAFVRGEMKHLVEARPWADNLLAPDDIAEAYYALHQQPRSAWTHELDLRPWAEPW